MLGASLRRSRAQSLLATSGDEAVTEVPFCAGCGAAQEPALCDG